MKKIVIIGGSGHIGSYLIPKLVKAGNRVINVSRGQSKPYKEDSAWGEVENLILDREKEGKGVFEQKIAALDADVVVDLINFTLEDTKRMAEALKNTTLSHYLFCSSIWTHGKTTTLPIIEDQPKYPLCEYGIEKVKSENYLQALYRNEGFPATIIMPGQISGAGWVIINPVGNQDYKIFDDIRKGKEVVIPNLGQETLHHVHADDVAQVFFLAITHRNEALGESFHAVGSQSITLLGFAQAMYRHFGQKENIRFATWEEWCAYTKDEVHIEKTYLHIARSGYFSIEKARRLLEYHPRHTLLETLEESVDFMVNNNWFDKFEA